MHKIVGLLLVCLFMASMTTKAQSKDEKQVATAVEALKQAMLSGEKKALEEVVANDLSYGHSSGRVEGKQAFIEALVTKKSDFVTIDLANQSIQVSGKTALVRHQLSATTNDSGNPGTVKLGVLLVWQKQHGQWKLLARQAYKL
ncbi:DUF4440 domain-containing protein [Nibribacter ruber]|uniref:DUF4440 domain-containing protein n=1 Tax=Nibribacter ruber TaxID=2698458 RepID=A0A6P1P1A7_9BACT|nr:nuclear transport factor 2 family protein [Nibribacter ruber]QHL87393.1 DUF4440 domain-containing protein [Nibribacter ruber]